MCMFYSNSHWLGQIYQERGTLPKIAHCLRTSLPSCSVPELECHINDHCYDQVITEDTVYEVWSDLNEVTSILVVPSLPIHHQPAARQYTVLYSINTLFCCFKYVLTQKQMWSWFIERIAGWLPCLNTWYSQGSHDHEIPGNICYRPGNRVKHFGKVMERFWKWTV